MPPVLARLHTRAASRAVPLALVAAAALATAAACGNEPESKTACPADSASMISTGVPAYSTRRLSAARELTDAQTVGTTAAAAPRPTADEAAGGSSAGGAAGVLQQALTQSVTQSAADTPMIIRTGGATLEVDSLDSGVARVRQLVQSIPGAYVANLNVEGGREQVRRATLEVKLPAAQFDRLVTGLTPLGKVEAVSVNAQDVSEEFVDLGARAENARRLEARLVDLLERRTGRLQDVLAVERELARVREEIERYDGRLRFLRTRAAISTLAVTVHEPTPILGDRPAENPIAEAVRQSWRNFVALVAAIVALSGVLIPLGVLAYVAWILTRRFRRPAVPAIE